MKIRFVAIAALLAVCSAIQGAETYDEKLATTDRRDPNSLYELVVWCQANNYRSSAQKHIREILAIDPNHAPTQELRGFVWNGKRWVHKSRLPRGGTKTGSQGGSQSSSKAAPVGPAPKASEIKWDLSFPANPDTDGGMSNFLKGELRHLNSPRNTGSWSTLMLPQQHDVAMILLKEAIANGSFTNVAVPMKVAAKLIEDGKRNEADGLVPFMVKASEQATDVESLAEFAYKIGTFGDKRVVPRLIELLDHSDENVQFNTKYSLAQFMVRPLDDITKESATAWWARFHAASDAVIFAQGLKDSDPMVQIKAISAITRSEWSDAVMPVLIEIIQGDNNLAYMEAARLLQRITGSGWDIEMSSTKEQRKGIAKRLDEWWGENKGRFRPLYVRTETANEAKGPAKPQDRIGEWIAQLGDVNSNVSSGATNQLRNRGERAIFDLIHRGLTHSDGITRNRVRDLLREITGQSFGFEGIKGGDPARRAAVDQWKSWAEANGHTAGSDK